MQTVLITGTSGCKVAEFADAVADLGNKAGKAKWTHVRFAEIMYDLDHIISGLSYSAWEDSILRREAVLSHLRAVAFDRLVTRHDAILSNEEPLDQILLISTHATFWYRKTLMAGVDSSRIAEIDVDLFVTLVDDVLNVWKRLSESNQIRWKELSPVDILEWREIETFFTEQMAFSSGQKGKPKPFYVIARDYKPDILFRIISEQGLPKYYRSYPITFVSERPDVKAQADYLGEELQKIAIVFNPMGIRDLERKSELKEKYETWCDERGYKDVASGWREIEQHLQHQTVSRDHRLINQSGGLVVFYPELEYFTKKNSEYVPSPLVPFSSGVLDEMQYGTQKGKEIYLVWTSKKDPGPFLPHIYTERFESIEKLLLALDKHPYS